MRKIFFLIVIGFLSGQINFAQQEQVDNTGEKFAGVLSYDSQIISGAYNNDSYIQPVFQMKQDKKSVFLSGLLSFILPGAGEFYSESYIKAAAFLVVEGAIITTAVIYDGKGDDQTEEFENYADEHWSPKRYAQWTLDNLENLNPGLDPADFNVIRDDGSVDWAELNRLESQIGRGYSHQLEAHGEQQYYELIGKYPQYSHGWDDANLNETDYHILSDRFLLYSDMRGQANDYYNVASTAVALIYVNHVLSMIDGVWSAVTYNNSLEVSVRLKENYYSRNREIYPTVNLKYNF